MKHSYNLRRFAQLGVALVLLLLLAVPGAQGQAVRLYYTQGSGSNAALDAAKAVNPDGTAGATLASGATNFRQPAGIAFDQANSFVYVADHYLGATGIVRYNNDGTNRTVVVPPTAGATYNGLALDAAGNRLFFTQGSATNPSLDALKVVSLDAGFAVTTLTSGAASFTQPTDLALDATNGFLYVADQFIGSGGILRFSLTGTGRIVVVPALANAAYNGLSLDVAGNRLFFTQGSADAALDALKVVSLAAGFAVTTLASGAVSFTQPTDLALDATNGFLYVADQFVSTGGILRFSTAGASRTVIVPPTAGATYNGLALAVSVAVAPTVTTAAATSITTASAVLGGNVTADGGANVTGRGVVYSSTNTAPAIGGSGVTQDPNGSGAGTFSETISSLAGGTTYYVRAYATNSAGTSYGSVRTFTTPTTVVSIVRVDPNPTNAATVRFTVTFANSVTGISLSNFSVPASGSISGLSISSISGSGTTYTVIVNTGSGSGTLRLNLANSTGLSPSVSSPFTSGESYIIDRTAPTVDISSSTAASGSTSSASPFAYTVTFSEAVTDFGAGDVSVGNGALSAFTPVSATTYTFNVTPAGNGAVTVNVPANVAQDVVGNNNTAAPAAYSITYAAPAATVVSVTRLTPSPTATASVNYRVAFSASVTGVTTSTFSPTTTGAIAGASVASVTGSGTTYTVAVNTGTGDGTLRLDVTSATGISPTVSNAPFTTGEVYTITKNFPAQPQLTIVGTGGTGSDVTAFVDVVQVLNGGSPFANALQNGSFETHDPLGNSNFSYNPTGASWAFNSRSGIAEAGSAFTPAAPIPNGIAVAFVQSTSGINGQLQQNLALPTGSNYQLSFGAAQRVCCATLDQALNVFVNGVFVGTIQPAPSGFSTFTSASFNVTAPALTASITSTATSPTSISPIPVTVTFSEAVSGFVAGDVSVGNGTLSDFAGSGTTYTFSVTPAGNGAVTVNVPANTAIDANNMGNSAAPQFSITYSQAVTAAPVVLAPANGSLLATATPTYSGTAPAGSTVTVIVDGTSIGTTTANGSGSWNLSQPTDLAQGSHTVRATAQASGSAVSASSNTNNFTVDMVAPQTSIASAPPANTNSTTATFSFSSNESPVTYQASLDGAGFTTTANSRVYTGLADGSHTLSVRAVDATGNVDATPATYSWNVDTTIPTVAISSTATSPTSASPIPVTVTFSEDVSGFVAGDVSVGNGTLSGFAGSGTTYTFSVTPAGNGVVTVNVPANTAEDAAGNGNSAAPQFSIQYTAPITVAVWNGSVSTNWFTAANWTGGLPTATIDATIPAGAPRYPVLAAGTASANGLALSAGASLTQNGGLLDLKGSFVNNGSFSTTGGSVALTGAASQAMGGSAPSTFWNLSVGPNGASLTGTAAVQRVLTLAGSLTTDGNSFTLLSNAAGTAMVVNSGGTVVGNATVQRYINPGLNAGAGYRHYSSPVANSTVADLATAGFGPVVNGGYNTSATPTAVKPYPTVFGYDQSRLATTSNNLAAFDKGWFSPAAATAALAVGRGYTVNLRANQVVDFVGTLNNGDQTLSLARNSGATAAAAGWQLVGNQYPAPLDFSLVAASDRPNLDAAMYVFESTSQYNGQYRSYINGLGNPVVTMGQGFFVRVSEGQTTGSLTFRNSQRLTTYQDPTFRRGTTETRPLVQLQLGGPAAGPATDNTHVYFEAGATAGLDSQFDAVKLANSTGLNLSSLAQGSELSINGLPLPVSTSLVVPLRVRVPATGTYTLTALQVLNFSPNAQPFLRDLQLNTLTDLRQQPSYTFTQNAANSTPRFELVFARQVLATASAALVAQVAVYPNPATKAVFLELPAVLSRKAVTAALVDALGRVVVQQVLPAGRATHTMPLANVATGVYSLRLQTQAGVVVKKLVVE